jgi:argininosuccinate lyase
MNLRAKPPSRWHAAYRRWVLARHYRFGREHLIEHFLDGLTAYALGLHDLGVPKAGEAAQALAALRKTPLPSYSGAVEDVFFAIDLQLSEVWGTEVAGSIRRGLSRNDLDLTVFRAYARDRTLAVMGDLLRLRQRLLVLAEDHIATLMTAYTHHQPAQPSSLGHYLAAVENLLSRDHHRLVSALLTVDCSPLGASSLAGSPYPVDRLLLAQRLGFGGVVENSYDAIAAGDWALELAQALAGLGTSLSRLARDLLFWAERGGFLVGSRIAQGSSIMPQKHNPVIFEHVRVYCAELIGGATNLAQLNHSTPFGDANDHSTGVLEALDRLCEAAEGALELTRVALEESRFVPEVLAAGLADRAVLASELVDVLVAGGYVALGEAHGRVKALLGALAQQKRSLAEVKTEDLLTHLGYATPELLGALEPTRFLERRLVQGGVAPQAQKAHLKLARRRLAGDRKDSEAIKARIRAARLVLAAASKQPEDRG